MAVHVKVIAVVDLVLGALFAVGAFFVLVAFVGGAGLFANEGEGGLAGFLAGFGVFLALIMGAFAALYLVAGALLLKRRPAGKMWGIVAAIPSLLNFPLGTALGIYALVILTRRETDQLLGVR